jgi:hypothetical protein
VTRAGGDGAASIAVPTSFIYNMEYSATTLVNTIFDWMVNTQLRSSSEGGTAQLALGRHPAWSPARRPGLGRTSTQVQSGLPERR